MADDAFLKVRDLRTQVSVRGRERLVVDGVSFSLDAGETLGLVGQPLRGAIHPGVLDRCGDPRMDALHPVLPHNDTDYCVLVQIQTRM